MKTIYMSFAAIALAVLALGCESKHQSGVKSNLHSQWTTVAASTTATTDAAKAVLEAEGLKDITATSTNVDGAASGKKADGTTVKVKVAKESDTVSTVSVSVGIGDPSLGAELAKKIKDKAEGK